MPLRGRFASAASTPRWAWPPPISSNWLLTALPCARGAGRRQGAVRRRSRCLQPQVAKVGERASAGVVAVSRDADGGQRRQAGARLVREGAREVRGEVARFV